MRGHITKRCKNSYTIVLSLGNDPATGKRKQQWLSIKGTKKDAEKRLSELLSQLDTGGFVRPSKLTLGEFLEQWLRDYVWPNLAPTTSEIYEFIINHHLVPALGNLPLTQLKPEVIQRYISEKLERGRCDGKGGLSPKTVRHHYVTLHDALSAAVKWGLLARNPADAISPPRVQCHEMQTWNEDEVTLFLKAAKGTPYYCLFYIALYTGMRRSELLPLRWQDIDLILGQISVSRSLHRPIGSSEPVFREPKTASGRRTIALSPSAIMVLKEHQEKQKLECIMLGKSLTDDNLVFSCVDGKSLSPDNVTHAWFKLVRRTGLKPIRLHDARHTHASLMLKQGIHPKIVQERLGHSSIQITLDTYSHIAPGLQKAAAERFDELVNHTPKNEPAKNFG